MVFTGFYMFLLGSSLPESASAPSPMVQLNAEMGTLFIEQGILKVAVEGFYVDDKLSKREVSYRAGDQTPVDAAMACRAATANDFDSPPLGLADGQFHSVTLAPGKRQAFSVDNHDFFFDTLPYATRYPGGRCRLHLHLENSEEVVSTEFTP
jgi:hypothetical protein